MPALRKLSTSLAGALLGCAALASVCPALAQDAPPPADVGFALQRFVPAPAGDRFFGVASPHTSGEATLHVALVLDYASNPLLISRVKGITDPTGVVTDQMMFHASATFAFLDRFSVNLDLPAAIMNDGDDPVFRGTLFASPHNAGFADVRIGLRARILGEEKARMQIAVQGFLWAPTGTREAFTGDDEARGMPQLLLGGFRDRFVWSFTVGPHLRPKATYNGVPIGNSMEFGAALGIRVGDRRRLQVGPEVTVGFGIEDQKRRNTHAEILLGAKYKLAQDFEAGVAVGPGVTPGYGTPEVRFVGSVAYTPDRYPPPKPPVDTDADGVNDDLDQCPKTPMGDLPDRNKPGCPAPPDQDKDGVPDDSDACLNVWGVASTEAAKNGCPGDADNDGVLDKEDKCPDIKGDRSDPLMLGCPPKKDPDSDGDGVLDRDDACPTVKGAPNADRAKNGCAVDSDGDSVTDDQDACPEIRGLKDQDPKKNGCPKIVRLVGTEIVILQQVQFKTGTAALTGNSDEILSEVAAVLKERAEVLKVEVQGHTDDKGKKDDNKKLSQSRAESVVKALVAKGIAAARLVAKGYGQDVPIGDNKTEEGREKNRRVVFKIVEKAKR